ncbi:MAG: GNAT family N-acetyltransferase [Rhizobiaceae bacterium]
MPGLSQIRRLEAASFRAWPSASTYYDGTWSIRLTPNHGSRRLNSINPLDPNDHSELSDRIERAKARFEAAGKPLTFRQTPLASRELDRFLKEGNFAALNESAVMSIELSKVSFDKTIDHIPFRDIRQYCQASTKIHGGSAIDQAGLAEVISSIKAPFGLFIMEDADGPISCVICVQDGELAGILDLATRPDARRQGHAKQLLLGAMKWAKSKGATTAWLQVELGPDHVEHLYKDIGFREIYRYIYRVLQAGK